MLIICRSWTLVWGALSGTGVGRSCFLFTKKQLKASPLTLRRSWTLVWGALSLLMTLIPTFRDFRLLNVIAMAGTGFTAM